MTRNFLYHKLFAVVLLTGAVGFATKTLIDRPALSPKPEVRSVERDATPPGMVYVSGGDYIMGTDDPDADEDVKPAHRIFVPSFYMDKTEVTKAEFKRFKPDYSYPPGEDKMPATAVNYDEAEAYAKSVGKHVPTEAEWEKAARGTDGRRYPWGNDWDKTKVAKRGITLGVKPAPDFEKKLSNACRIAPNRVQPVGSVAQGVSPYGALDMAGNAWEWVQGHYLGHPDQRILRGGAVGYGEHACRVYSRAVEGSDSTCNDTGFRCAKAISEKK